jgi:hypothetical protein
LRNKRNAPEKKHFLEGYYNAVVKENQEKKNKKLVLEALY